MKKKKKNVVSITTYKIHKKYIIRHGKTVLYYYDEIKNFCPNDVEFFSLCDLEKNHLHTGITAALNSKLKKFL